MRILGITIPDHKRLDIALTAIYGVGYERARNVLDKAGVAYETKARDISAEEENKIRHEIEQFRLEGDLKREISANIKRLKDIQSYRGIRHMRALPNRGQRTKTNSRTRRGNTRKTMGTGRRAAEKK